MNYLFESNQAYIACAKTHCQHCAAEIDVITLYCVTGQFDGEPLEEFSIMHITEADEALQAQLAPWPFFRRHKSVFYNHCPYCQGRQEDMDLHCEPDGPFFYMDEASRQSMTLTPLVGRVRLSGAETFQT